jgi:hypothetical protein
MTMAAYIASGKSGRAIGKSRNQHTDQFWFAACAISFHLCIWSRLNHGLPVAGIGDRDAQNAKSKACPVGRGSLGEKSGSMSVMAMLHQRIEMLLLKTAKEFF